MPVHLRDTVTNYKIIDLIVEKAKFQINVGALENAI